MPILAGLFLGWLLITLWGFLVKLFWWTIVIIAVVAFFKYSGKSDSKQPPTDF